MATDVPSNHNHHDDEDAPPNNPLRHDNEGMLTECATNVPTAPEGCQDERELEEAAAVPLPVDVDSDGQATDGLEKSGEEVPEYVGKWCLFS